MTDDSGRQRPDSALRTAATVPRIYQIYYSEATRRSLDPGFIPLDNSANERPDWREYWPIRNYLRRTDLEADRFYGFLSPKFGSKTNLDAARVHQFLGTRAEATDVVLFSPYFDQSAFFVNQIEQGQVNHPSAAAVLGECALLIAPEFRPGVTLSTSMTTVYCNYFIAKPAFWSRWFECCERIFHVAEEARTELGKSLNAPTSHDGSLAPVKVFVIERVATLLLSLESRWSVRAYDSSALPFSVAPIARMRGELVALDALKIAYLVLGSEAYLKVFHDIRRMMLQATK